MYAIVRTGGKQYRVAVEDTIAVEKLEVEPGSTVELQDVLFVGDDNGVKIGTPYVVGAKVVATAVRQGKGKKIVGFNYKAKKNIRKRYGHRQLQTVLKVTDIVA